MRDGGTMRWLMLQVAELVVDAQRRSIPAAAQRRSIPAEIHIECMCKSGRHRSVAVAFLLAGALAANGLEFDGAVHRAADWWSAVPCQRGGAECELCFGPGKIKSQVGGVSMLKPRVQLCIETGKRLIYGVWSYRQFGSCRQFRTNFGHYPLSPYSSVNFLVRRINPCSSCKI